MQRLIRLMRLGIAMTAASMAAGCGTSGPGDANGLRRIVGNDLIGARGATPADQRKIDRTVVGLCAGNLWTGDDCAAHGAHIGGRNG